MRLSRPNFIGTRLRLALGLAALVGVPALASAQQATITGRVVAAGTGQPLAESRQRKPLQNPQPSFEYEPPLWELRVGNFRVFYDVDETGEVVFIRAVREKPPPAETEDVL